MRRCDVGEGKKDVSSYFISHFCEYFNRNKFDHTNPRDFFCIEERFPFIKKKVLLLFVCQY